MRKIITYTILGLLVIVLGVVIISCSSNSLRKSETEIRDAILELTPIGTSMDDVIRVIESYGKWEWGGHISPNGFPTDASGNTRIGEQSIRVTIGTYKNFYKTFVVVFWGFDGDSNLIDIRVRKDIAGV